MTGTKSLLMAAGAFGIAPTIAMSAPPAMHGPTTSAPTATTPSRPSPGSGPAHITGQPNQSCQTINGGNTGPSYPGNTSTAPGSAFNETNGKAGGMYAGSQPQNSKNTASVAQYDVACANQPH